jgi:hypothetical protein
MLRPYSLSTVFSGLTDRVEQWLDGRAELGGFRRVLPGQIVLLTLKVKRGQSAVGTDVIRVLLQGAL